MPDQWKQGHEYHEGSLVVPTGNKSVQRVHYRCVSVSGDTMGAVDEVTATGEKPASGARSGKTEPDWDKCSTDFHGHVTDAKLKWQQVDLDLEKYAAGMKIWVPGKPRRVGQETIKHRLPKTSLMPIQYYHFDEVWHTLYNRAETTHLKDPENTSFEDESARQRQTTTFQQIMKKTAQDLRKRVDHSIEYDVTMPVVHDANPYTLSIATAMQSRYRTNRKRKQLTKQRGDEKERLKDDKKSALVKPGLGYQAKSKDKGHVDGEEAAQAALSEDFNRAHMELVSAGKKLLEAVEQYQGVVSEGGTSPDTDQEDQVKTLVDHAVSMAMSPASPKSPPYSPAGKSFRSLASQEEAEPPLRPAGVDRPLPMPARTENFQQREGMRRRGGGEDSARIAALKAEDGTSPA